uniref:Uncharacterized protein n=1 Tax=Rhizophora mucronata TaxID=61149 RepID=A0A2P2QMT1_RHIMU
MVLLFLLVSSVHELYNLNSTQYYDNYQQQPPNIQKGYNCLLR